MDEASVGMAYLTGVFPQDWGTGGDGMDYFGGGGVAFNRPRVPSTRSPRSFHYEAFPQGVVAVQTYSGRHEEPGIFGYTSYPYSAFSSAGPSVSHGVRPVAGRPARMHFEIFG